MTMREPDQERSLLQTNRLAAVLFSVFPSRQDSSEYRKARFLVTASFILSAGVGFLVFLLLQIAPAEILPYLPVLFSSVIANTLAYVLGRTRYYRLGSWFLLLGLSATGFSLIPLRPEDVVDQLSSTLPLAFVIGSLLFTVPEFAIFASLNVITIFLIPRLIPELETPLMIAQAIVYTLLAIIVSIVTSIRSRSERERLGDVEQANKALTDARQQLEDRIAERTDDLVRKTLQLRASAEVARQATSIHNINDLLNEVTLLIANRFDLYHVGIFLVTGNAEELILQTASSEGGKKLLEHGFRLNIDRHSIVGSSAQEKKAFIALDVGKSAEFFNDPNLPSTRSEIALPLIAGDEVLGVLDLQSSEPEAFTDDDIDTFQVMADQIAVAITNTRLMAESEAIIAQLQTISSENIYSAWKAKSTEEKIGYIYTPTGISNLVDQKSPTPEDSGLIKIPVQLRGQRIGTIKLRRRENETWSDRETSLVTELATQIGLAIENARLLEATLKRAEREQLVGEISSHATQTLDIDSMLQQVVRELGLAVDTPNAFVQIGLPETDEATRE